jgi:hypothetical protein
VRNVVNVVALPAFVLGVKIPRYQPKAGAVEPDVLAVDAAGQPLAGVDMTVRFIKRNWTSVLQASDFSQGAAKYVTQKVASTKEALRLAFEAREAGVYLVQVEGSDRIGRRQQVSVDFFVGGDTPVTWARPPAQTATVTTDKESYAPGETATLVIQSPFQAARALAVVEEPEGQFRYDWVDIANGFGRFRHRAQGQMPKLAVPFLIMRRRLATACPGGRPDPGKPVAIAGKWITIKRVRTSSRYALEYPERHARARGGFTLRLADGTGRRSPAGDLDDGSGVARLARTAIDPAGLHRVGRATRSSARH